MDEGPQTSSEASPKLLKKHAFSLDELLVEHAVADIKTKPSRRVLILYCGGTLGMIKSTEGFHKPDPNFLKTTLQLLPEFADANMPEFELETPFDPVDSSEMCFTHWIRLAQEIKANYHRFDGFVLIHGTDTMAYSASALSFLLENLGKPVVLTGSQIPLYVLRSDAKVNMVDSMLLAAHSNVPEVMICFASKVLRGNRCRKVNSWDIGAFVSHNFPNLGAGGLKLTTNPKITRKPPTEQLTISTEWEPNVAILKIFPGPRSVFKGALDAPLRGAVLECFGNGNIPLRDVELVESIKAACDRGCVIVICSQCWEGTVVLENYEAGSMLAELGCVSGLDMTSETAYAKLSYLLGKGLPVEKVKELMTIDLRGEVTESKAPNEKYSIVF